MYKPLITIITATYNSEATLERCIQSVMNQSYATIEFIVIDGGSSDGTVSILKRYDKFIATWISERDNGVYDAWNKGLKLAKGEWISFLGSDDMLYDDAIQKYVSHIASTSRDYNFVSSRIHITNKSDEVIRTLGWEWKWPQFKRVCTIAHPGALHHKTLFAQLGGYNTGFKICGDYDLLLRAGDSLKAGFMNEVTVRMQVGGLSDSYKVYIEIFKVVVGTGGLNYVTASWDFGKEYSKFLVKRIFRSVGINLALKK